MRVPVEVHGWRLDQALTKLLGNLSRAQVQKKIKARRVMVNGKVAASSLRISQGDIIEIQEEEARPGSDGTPFPRYRMIQKTDDYMVIEKPAGVVVHPTSIVHGRTLSEVLVKDFPELQSVGEDPTRPGIVHRLDRDVSGLMIVARTQDAFQHLKSQFQQGRVQKIYLGLVHGVLTRLSGEIDFPIARSKTHRHKMAAQPGRDGRPSITTFEVIKNYQQFTYLKLFPKTGRTHQLRVHLNAINHPLVGDSVYHPRKWNVREDLGRIFLHAHRLTFTDLRGKEQTFQSPLPPELEAFLTGLAKGRGAVREC